MTWKEFQYRSGRAVRAVFQKWKRLTVTKKILFTLGMLAFLPIFYALLLLIFYPPITVTQCSSVLSGRGLYRDYVSMKEISPNIALAVIAAEDQIFVDHFGFDVESIRKALEYNTIKKGKKTRGASTITQQTAKNIFLWQGRSWLRKGLEIYFTFVIEILWPKKYILSQYLNVIEMGDGIFGIEAAAQAYFKKPASQLSMEESAAIAAALPNPRRFKVKPASTWVQLRKPWVIQQMQQLKDEPEIIELLSAFGK
jgi:monofunctional biosynthetic peptidoglycan transglycosylase